MFLSVSCILHQKRKKHIVYISENSLRSCYLQMFMGRPLRVAHSRRFLKLETKMADQTEDVATPLNTNSEQSGKRDDDI